MDSLASNRTSGSPASDEVSQELSFRGADGDKLVGDVWGDPSSPPVVLLHGGGQTRHAWGQTGSRLAAAGWYAIAVDQRGHGDSDWISDGDYGADAYVRDLAAIHDQCHSAPAVVGASLGGIAGMLAVGEKVRSFPALVLVDCAPRLEDVGVRKIIDFMSGGREGFSSIEEAADSIARYLPHRKRPKDVSGLAKNLRQKQNGRYHWHWDPKFIEGRRNPPGPRDPSRLIDAAKEIEIPSLLVRGRMSDVVSEENAREFLQLVPHAEFVDVSGAGHMVAGDRNDIFSDAVVAFLEKLNTQ